MKKSDPMGSTSRNAPEAMWDREGRELRGILRKRFSHDPWIPVQMRNSASWFRGKRCSIARIIEPPHWNRTAFPFLIVSASHGLGNAAAFRLIQDAIYFERTGPKAHPYHMMGKHSLPTLSRERKVLRSFLRRSAFVHQRTSLSSAGIRSDNVRTPVCRHVVG